MLYAATSDEVREKDITGKYLTPYGFINNATDGKPAADPSLRQQIWRRSIELCEYFVPEMEITAYLKD